MSLFSGLRTARALTDAQLEPQIEAWLTGTLTPVDLVMGDLGLLDGLPPTRAEAMTVPAIARARKLLCTTVAAWPLRAYRGADPLPDLDQPGWMHATDGAVSPWHRMLWTVDDCLFYGWSLWRVTAFAADSAGGFPLRMGRVPYEAWDVSAEGKVIDADGQEIPPGELVLIPGPDEGILATGRRTIRTAALLEATTGSVASHPFRLEVHQISGDQLTPAERGELIAETRRALSDNEGIIYTNQAIETKELGAGGAEQLLIEGRNASAVDCARLVGIPAAMIDATSAGASLTYETTAGRNQQFLDYGAAAYSNAIAARLGMDDVLPRGQRATLDSTEFTAPAPAPGGPATLD